MGATVLEPQRHRGTEKHRDGGGCRFRRGRRSSRGARSHQRPRGSAAGYAAVGHRVTVVFDAAENPGSDGSPHHIGPLSVIFSAAGHKPWTFSLLPAPELRHDMRAWSAFMDTCHP